MSSKNIFDLRGYKHSFDHAFAAQKSKQRRACVTSTQPILTCRLGLAHCDSNEIGTLVPQRERRGESKCTSGRTNIDCNSVGVPHGKGTRRVGTSARSSVHCRRRRALSSQIDSASLQRDLSTGDAMALRSLRSALGWVRSLGDVWRRANKRNAGGCGQGIDAADDVATASLSREDREALCLVKAPSFSVT
jgi:hypothetical protein